MVGIFKMIKSIITYIKEVLVGLKSLLKGMRVTGYYISHPKEIITQQYPENKNTLKMFDRFRGEVILLHDKIMSIDVQVVPHVKSLVLTDQLRLLAIEF